MQPDYSLAFERREDAGCNRLKPSDLLILIREGFGDLTTAEKTMLLFFHVCAISIAALQGKDPLAEMDLQKVLAQYLSSQETGNVVSQTVLPEVCCKKQRSTSSRVS